MEWKAYRPSTVHVDPRAVKAGNRQLEWKGRNMAKSGVNNSIASIMEDAVAPAVDRMVDAITRMIATEVSVRLEAELRDKAFVARASRRRTRRRGDIAKWVADRRARRVPNFVIEATGLDTKKKIVAKYGEGVAFEKGKALPKPK